MPLLGSYNQASKSCVLTIKPNVTAGAIKKIAVIACNSWQGHAVDVTVDSIKIGNYTPTSPVHVLLPSGTAYTAVARGFSVPVIPGQNIEIHLTLNNTAGAYQDVSMALALEN
jgi:hypothetical protein